MNAYPVSTELASHLSIFYMAFKHDIGDAPSAAIDHVMTKVGWTPHHLFTGDKPANRAMLDTPELLTDATRKVCFPDYGGASKNLDFLSKAMGDTDTTATLTAGRALRRNIGFSLTESAAAQWIGVPLALTLNDKNGRVGGEIPFSVEWVDLWFFNDQTAVLCFKTKLSPKANQLSPGEGGLDLNDLTTFNQQMRSPSTDELSKCQVKNVTTGHVRTWWPDIVFGQWLAGNGVSVPTECFLQQRKIFGISVPVRMTDAGDHARRLSVLGEVVSGLSPKDRRDRYSRYAKCLTMAELGTMGTSPNPDIPGLSGASRQHLEYLWNAPVTDPPFDFSKYYDDCKSGTRMDVFSTYHFATMEGYPTAGDYLLYDLATTGKAGAAAGFGGDTGWQISPEYLKGLLDSGGIEIWEYWRGLALHDTLAILVTDTKMPMSALKPWGSQAETRYYYLYVYLYHIQYKLNMLSSDIIDGDLIDLYKSRLMQNRFNQFRNQYWFRDLTVDFQGVHIADKLKSALRLNDSFETVQAEIGDVAEFISDKLEKGRQALFGTLLAVAYPFLYLTEISGLQEALAHYGEVHPLESGVVATLMLVIVGYLGIRFGPNLNLMMFRLYNRVYNRGKH